MAKFIPLKVDYEIPPLLQKAIDELQQGVEDEVLYVDCLQDEVRGSCRILGDDEKEKEIIDYYCRRRWF